MLQVWKAEADDLKGHDGLTRLVAVKTIKDGAGSKEREDLHRELFIMQKIGSHPNVVQLLGCCTDKGKSQLMQTKGPFQFPPKKLLNPGGKNGYEHETDRILILSSPRTENRQGRSVSRWTENGHETDSN